jgi:ergothioneine biosynthesis protein EgtB
MTGEQDPRRLHGTALADALRESRATTLARAWPAIAERRPIPRQAGVNPLAWELGHLAWFADFWVRRGPHAVGADGFVHAGAPALEALPDAIYDSSRLAHADRWQAPLHGPDRLADVLAETLDATLAAIPSTEDDARLAPFRLALFHEDMHAEAFAWTAASLGWPAPPGLEAPPRMNARQHDLWIPATPSFALGRAADEPGYAFDNELPQRTVALDAFAIDAEPRPAGDVLAFVEAGGYAEPSFWRGSDAAAWRAARTELAHPARWRRASAGSADGWQLRWFDRWLPLDPAMPALFLSAFESEAIAAWLGRRLPTAAEWERASLEAGFAWGGMAWEWAADAFRPYPGFVPGPYRDYSAPWFDDHRELRGSSPATVARLHDRRYRNFFRAERTDLFTGFRTAGPPPISV